MSNEKTENLQKQDLDLNELEMVTGGTSYTHDDILAQVRSCAETFKRIGRPFEKVLSGLIPLYILYGLTEGEIEAVVREVYGL